MYYSKYIQNIYNSGVKLYFGGKPVSPLILRYLFCVNHGKCKLSTVYDLRGNLKEVRYSRR